MKTELGLYDSWSFSGLGGGWESEHDMTLGARGGRSMNTTLSLSGWENNDSSRSQALALK